MSIYITISLIVSAEEVDMTVSVRDSPGEIRAGYSSEKGDNDWIGIFED